MVLSLTITAALFGALWRFWDGLDRSQSRLPAAFRGVIFAVAAVAVCKLSGKTWPVTLFMAAAATLNITVGHTDWKDWAWQAIRFGSVAALTVLPLNHFSSSIGYVAMCAGAGMFYPWLFWYHKQNPLPRWINIGPDPMDAEGCDRYLFDGPEAYARLPLGAAILGGLAPL